MNIIQTEAIGLISLMGYDWVNKNRTRAIGVIRDLGTPVKREVHESRIAIDAALAKARLGELVLGVRTKQNVTLLASSLERLVNRYTELRHELLNELRTLDEPAVGAIIQYYSVERDTQVVATRVDRGPSAVQWSVTGFDGWCTWDRVQNDSTGRYVIIKDGD